MSQSKQDVKHMKQVIFLQNSNVKNGFSHTLANV